MNARAATMKRVADAAVPEASDLQALQGVAMNTPTTGPTPTECTHAGMRFVLVTDSPGKSPGVYFHGKDRDGNDKLPMWLCSPLRILAKTRDERSGQWGRLLEWHDEDGTPHRWAMPMSALEGDFITVMCELASKGLAIAPGNFARQMMQTFLKVWPAEQRARCVRALGWFGGVYVLPDSAIGETGERVVFQNGQALESALSQAGTLDAWRATVGNLAAGNSRPMFCLSLAFAAPLLELSGVDCGGFHLRGESSKGKSTAGIVAASVWGNPKTYVRQWRATTNALEGLAQLHNDGLLVLDEINQAKEAEIGEAAYMLANGQGKSRAGRDGAAREAARWRLLFLSTGEKTLAAIMAAAGKETTAGQEIRMVDIEADAGAGHGLYERLNGAAGGADLSRRLVEAAGTHYGTAGAEFLRLVVAQRADLVEPMRQAVAEFVRDAVPAGAAGQVERVARRFGLVAHAGELARVFGLVPWKPGEATAAARTCFTSWLATFGGVGNREERSLLNQVRGFFELHGSSRFENLDLPCDGQRVMNRAGFVRAIDGECREFLVLPEVFKTEVVSGHETGAAVRLLIDRGWIKPAPDGKSATSRHIRGTGSMRVYVFTAEMWVTEPA